MHNSNLLSIIYCFHPLCQTHMIENTNILNSICLVAKCFIMQNFLNENVLFSDVWLHSRECFEKIISSIGHWCGVKWKYFPISQPNPPSHTTHQTNAISTVHKQNNRINANLTESTHKTTILTQTRLDLDTKPLDCYQFAPIENLTNPLNRFQLSTIFQLIPNPITSSVAS